MKNSNFKSPQQQQRQGDRPKRPSNSGGFRGNNREESEWQEQVLQIDRVTVVKKGGKKMSFRALIVIGDGKGNVGFAVGKAAEVAEAVRKAVEKAKKNTTKIIFDQGSIPHNIMSEYNASKIYLYRAQRGTGLIACMVIKTFFKLAGLHNVVAKVHGSTNKANLLIALFDALKKMKSKNQIKQMREVPTNAAA